MFQPKPPLSIDDQPSLGNFMLEIDQRRVPQPVERDETAVLIDAVLLELERLNFRVTHVIRTVDWIQADLQRRTWRARWQQAQDFCRYWWARLRGAVNGS
jgi:hypothetical protein